MAKKDYDKTLRRLIQILSKLSYNERLNTKEFTHSAFYSDGSLRVSFEISHDENIDNIIKAWLPHVEILAPQRFRNKLINELEEYLQKVKTK